MKKINLKKEITFIFLFTTIYILLSNAKSISSNPFMHEILLTSGIIIPLLAGIILNSRIAFFVAIIGGFVNYFFITNEIDRLLVIIPNVFVGVIAGLIKCKFPSIIVALLIIPANFIKYLLFNYFGVVNVFLFDKFDFLKAFIYENFIQFITIIIIISIYRIIILDKKKTTCN
ncbi:MAG: hypothetical protein ACLFPJ_00325 [Candidatus Woesearchaeota archaeon]